MLSIEKCYEILNKNEANYSNEQTKKIRELMYQLAEIIVQSKIEDNEKFRR